MKRLLPLGLAGLVLAALAAAFSRNIRRPHRDTRGEPTTREKSAVPANLFHPLTPLEKVVHDPSSPIVQNVTHEESADETQDPPPVRPLAPLPILTVEEARSAQGEDHERYVREEIIEDTIRPHWQVGQAWEVDTYYLQNQHREPTWTQQPLRWRFEVTGEDIFEGQRVFVVRASSEDTSGVLYVRTSDYRLIGLRDVVREQGEWRPRTFHFAEGSPIAEYSIVPFEMAPLGTKGTRLSSPVGRALPDPFSKEPAVEVPKTSGNVIDVHVTLPDGTTLTQRWDAVNPIWPLYSRTDTRISYLRSQ